LRTKALVGSGAVCVWTMLHATAVPAASSDVVLRATDASNLQGNWSRVADSSAADGQLLNSTNRGWATPDTPLPAPADYFDFTFVAPANTTYHVWLRLRAGANSKNNDSVYVQFSDGLNASGASTYGIGTTAALLANLQNCNSCKLSGWGWVDGAYGLTQSATLKFATSGSHTVRVQTREDGVQLDQLILSPSTYLTAAPGSRTNDTTIVPKPLASGLPAPWLSQDVGSTGLPGSSTNLNGVFTVAGAGADIWGTTDAFQFVYTPLSGDGQILARVATEQNTDTYAKAGVMMRESTAAGSTDVILDVRPDGGLEFMLRPSTGALTTFIAGGTQATPAWLKLVRSGATVTAYASASGTTWWVVGTTTVSMAATISAGLAVTSHNTTTLNVSTFDNVGVSAAVVTPPGTPASPSPTTSGTGVSTSATLSWSAAGATSYDVRFGATNPPVNGPAGLSAASYAPPGMTAGTTYYWQITARNMTGTTTGPIWSFTTFAGPPAAPTSPSPVSGATAVGVNTTLTWSAVGATSYDINLGTTNPPTPVAAGLLTASYSPMRLASGTTYYWQVVARNTAGASPGAVWSYTTTSTSGTTWIVNGGGDLQGAINNAQPGDTILLEAGATFTGNFVLPLKGGASYITIRSSAADSALPGPATRIGPGYAPQLPKIRSANSSPALSTAAAAHHFRLQTLEFLANYQGYGDILDLGDGSSLQNTLAAVPHDLIVDRVYIHGDATLGQKRGIGLHSASTSVINSYIADIKAVGQDSQAVCGWNGPGPFTIENNYLEAAGENVLFGGADPSIPNLVPSDITFRRNYLTKPLAWQTQAWSVKNLFELKNAQRVVVDGNVMEYNWAGGQPGYAVVFTPRNQDGTAPWSVVQQIQFTNNLVRHVSSGINILGNDDVHPSLQTNNILIRNNLFEDISAAQFGGAGRFVLITGSASITIDHNTVFEDGTTMLYAYGNVSNGFVFTNNIVPDNSWAIMGDNSSPGNATIARYFPSAQIVNGIFAGSNPATYPTGNYYPATMTAVGFVNLASGNYRLSSTSIYRGAATDGTDVGCNIDALNAAAGISY